MKVWGMVLGGYPRGRLARYSLRDRERGTIRSSQFSVEMLKTHAEVIGVQKAAGLPVVVDGMIGWHDIFRPFIRNWRNVSVDGLLRYFDNNFFYRIPVFTGEPDIIEPVWPGRVAEFSLLADPARLKIVLPGPVTMALMSKNKAGLSTEELAERIAYLLRREVELTLEYNVYVQIDEPILSMRNAEEHWAGLAVELANNIISGVEDRSIIAVYFDFPSKKILETLLGVRAKYVSLDIVDSPRRAEENALPLDDHVPVVGVVDGRRIHEDRISDTILSIIKKLSGSGDEIVLTTTTWMDLIPFRYALKKTNILGRMVDFIAERLGGEAVKLWR
ncbi:MAG: hypothetical protein F7C35_03135 [Desulfurococcales archaeon]|nr:hypothetical protein [Desulfurococcales archaeon]